MFKELRDSFINDEWEMTECRYWIKHIKSSCEIWIANGAHFFNWRDENLGYANDDNKIYIPYYMRHILWFYYKAMAKRKGFNKPNRLPDGFIQYPKRRGKKK